MGIMDYLGEAKAARDKANAFMAEKLGYMNEDGSVDTEGFGDARDSFAAASASMAKMSEIEPGVIAPSQVYSSPAPVMGQAPNPYAPVDYGMMQYQAQPMGGIGSAPSMEDILKALQSRGQ